MEEAHEFLTAAVQRLATSEDWRRMLAISQRLPNYSPLNCLLLATQGAQGLVMGYQAWKAIPAAGGDQCQVRRGAKGLKVFAPSTRTVEEVDDATGDVQPVRRLVGFRLITVFDQAALVAPPALPDAGAVRPTLLDLPDDEVPHRLWDALTHQVTAAGYRLVTDPETAQAIHPANGITDFTGGLVCVRPDVTAAQRVKTLAHELGHVRLHHPDLRPAEMSEARIEVEAESVAYLVTDALGLDSGAYSIPYVTGWSGGDVDLIVATAQRAITTARTISDALDHYLTGPAPATPLGPSRTSATGNVDVAKIDLTTALTELAIPTAPDGTEPAPTDSRGRVAEGAERHAPIGDRLRHADSCGVETPTGVWEIRWDPQLASYTAHHHASNPRNGYAHTVVGVADDRLPTVGALEVRLGFALPSTMRDQLTRSATPHPPAPPAPHAGALGGDEASLRPLPASRVQVPGTGDTTYQAAMAEEQPLRAWDCHSSAEGAASRAPLGAAASTYRVEILDAAPVTEPGEPPRQALTHRLSLNGTVIFSGDDVVAPLETDPRSDHAIQQVVHLLTYTDPDIPLTPTQAEFITHHAERLRALATLPQQPYPPGTRILVHPRHQATDTNLPGTAGGRMGIGVVVHATMREDGTVSSYAWRPDIANLLGHPWRDNPRHLLISRADHVIATLAGPDTGLQDWTPRTPLGYRAAVTFPADDGTDIPATVLRAHLAPDTAQIHYELLLDNAITSTSTGHDSADRPGRGSGTGSVIRLPAEQIQPQLGTAWPSLHDLITARAEDGVELRPGELLHAGRQIAHVADSPDGLTITRLPTDTLHFGEATSIPPAPPPTLPAATLHGDPPIASIPNATGDLTSSPGAEHSPRRCATPDCPHPAHVAVVVSWPNERQEITERCRPCAAELTAARMNRPCAVHLAPLPNPPFPTAETTPLVQSGHAHPGRNAFHPSGPTFENPHSPPPAPDAAL